MQLGLHVMTIVYVSIGVLVRLARVFNVIQLLKIFSETSPHRQEYWYSRVFVCIKINSYTHKKKTQKKKNWMCINRVDFAKKFYIMFYTVSFTLPLLTPPSFSSPSIPFCLCSQFGANLIGYHSQKALSLTHHNIDPYYKPSKRRKFHSIFCSLINIIL